MTEHERAVLTSEGLGAQAVAQMLSGNPIWRETLQQARRAYPSSVTDLQSETASRDAEPAPGEEAG